MSRYRKILVGIDFSEGSTEALRHALDLAAVFGGKVDVLHVWEPAPVVPGDTLVLLEGGQTKLSVHIDNTMRKRLATMVSKVAGDTAFIGEQHVEPGRVADTLLHRLEQGGYDLVVLGTHGRTGMQYLLLGSIAARVVRMAPCPVLTVRAKPSKAG